MFKLSRTGGRRLNSCHPLLQYLVTDVLKTDDVTVICGFRSEQQQDAAFRHGTSKLKWPMSKHNQTPSMAVDVVPYPIDWHNIERFKALAVVVKKCWAELPEELRAGYELQWGGDWEHFKDMPHWELRRVSDT